MANLGTLTLDVVAKVGSYVDGLSKAERASKKFKENAEKNLKAVGKAVTGFAAGAVGATALLVKSSINMADSLSKQSQIIGVNIEDLSALNYAAGLADVSFEELTSGLGRFSKTARDAFEGVGVGADAFKQLQIDVRNTDGSIKSAGDLVSEVAERFSLMEDGVLKTAIAQDFFGRSGAKLIPLLNGGAAGLAEMRAEAERLGIVIDQKTGSAAEQFNDNLTRLKATITGTGNEIAAGLLPQMVDLTNTINDPTTQQGIKALVTGLADIAIQLVKITALIPNVTKFLAESFAAFSGGAALGDLPRLNDELGDINEKLAYASKSKMFTPERVAEWEQEKARIEQLISLSEEFAASAAARAQAGTVQRNTPAAANDPFVPAIDNDEQTKAQESLNKLIKDRLDSYREQIILQGQSTELAKLQADIQLGKFAGASDPDLDLLQSEAMYADSIAAEQELKQLIDSRVASYGNVINALGEMSEVARLNFDIANGAFPGASEEDLASLRAYAESVDAIAWADKRREASEAFAEMESGLQKQIDLIGNTSEAVELLYDIEHGGYDQFTEDQQDKLLLLAQELEVREAMQKEIEENAKAQQKIMDFLVENTQNILADFLKGSFDDGLKGAADRFKQMLADLAAEAVAADIMKFVVGSFGGGKAAGGSTGSTIGTIASAFAGFFDGGGMIPAGQWGIAGENGAEIIRGPANITSTKDTAAMMAKGGNTNNVTFNFSGITNKQEAQQAASVAARQWNRMTQASSRMG